ncbi:ferredoxin-thioredoxin reductase catalytic domain-containing protein [Tepidibacillus marianensis]|uniref:ferredoxin-thioredoxin reductase catalytic domain-containing protein n=1 Tax=Tepidibacillus marianensis TaxID=3131995 RepID=UPI0030D0E9B8
MGKLKANLRMYKDFFGGYIKYREKIKKSDQWIQKYAEVKGLSVNPHKMYLTNLKIWLAENEDIYGQRICPCFEGTGDNKTDRQLTCPCTYAAHDIEVHGTCHCNLFGRADLTDAVWKEQEARIMKEYRIPLKKQGNIVDTRNVPQDHYRGMDVPDPVHQLKQSLNQFDETFQLIVEREHSAKNIVGYCNLKNIESSYEKNEDQYLVTVKK